MQPRATEPRNKSQLSASIPEIPDAARANTAPSSGAALSLSPLDWFARLAPVLSGLHRAEREDDATSTEPFAFQSHR